MDLTGAATKQVTNRETEIERLDDSSDLPLHINIHFRRFRKESYPDQVEHGETQNE